MHWCGAAKTAPRCQVGRHEAVDTNDGRCRPQDLGEACAVRFCPRNRGKAVSEQSTSSESADVWGLVAETPDRTALGFAEVAIRANRCDSRPVPLSCGRARFSGAGIRHANRESLVASGSLSRGFAETERVVYFRKRLGGRRRQMAARRL